jgi:prepilin-type N-terminal cleavage/methylation domain-containing protein
MAGEDGFTLPELLVTMAILLIVVASLASVLVQATRTEVGANTRFQAQGQARAALDQLRRELHCASAVTKTDGTAMAAGTSYNAITVNLKSVCPTTGGTALLATWCTSASTLTTGDFALYRVTSTTATPATCGSSGKVKWADYLQPTAGTSPASSNPFCLPSTATACGTGASAVLEPTASLPMLHVTLPVNLNGPSSTVDGYNLRDDIALRNGTRPSS